MFFMETIMKRNIETVDVRFGTALFSYGNNNVK